jgi:probable rRNA maturation factor
VTQKSNIHFEYEDIEAPSFLNQEVISNWLNDIASGYQSKIVNLQYIFCDDEYMLEVNREHLNHDYYTDIITFPYQEGKLVEADILISLESVQENADHYKVTYQEELMRVMVHGLLHVVGFSDKTEEESLKMRKAEDEAIAKIIEK